MSIRFSNLLIIAFMFLAGCAVYPVTRTYFDPNPEDGEPVPSMSCGYHRASKDSLSRDVGGVHIQVSPHYREGEDLSLSILFEYSEGEVSYSPERFEIYADTEEKPITPAKVERNAYGPDRTHARMEWLHISFPLNPEHVRSIRIVLPADAVHRNGHPLNLAPFRFEKVRKSDIYYASINC